MTYQITADDRKMARAALADRRAVAAASLRRDFGADAALWAAWAKSRGFRLPHWHTPVTPGGMRRWLRRLNLSWDAYKRFSGERRMTDFARHNPTWPLRAWVGLLLDSMLDLIPERGADEEAGAA